MTAGDVECNTELCLTAGGGLRSGGACAASEKRREITIFYGGQVCVGDATEIQARAIISMARREMEETMRKNVRPSSPPHEVSPPAPRAEPELLNPGLSMKKSLQRFLQKRKSRVGGSVPYHNKKKESPEAPDSSSFS